MTNRAAAGPVLALAVCFGGIPAGVQKPPNPTATQLPAVALFAAEGLAARLEAARLLREKSRTFLEYELVDTGDERLFSAELTLLVYDHSGRRRGAQKVSADLGAFLEPGGRKASRAEVSVRIDPTDRVLLGISGAVTSTGSWMSDQFDEQADKAQLPPVDVIDPRPMPIRIESPRLIEKDEQMQADLEFVNAAGDPVEGAALVLLVYDGDGKRWDLRPRRVTLMIENRHDGPLLRGRVSVSVSDSKAWGPKPWAFSKSCTFDLTGRRPPRAPVPVGGSIPFDCSWSSGLSDKLHKDWSMVIAVVQADTASEAWSASATTPIEK